MMILVLTFGCLGSCIGFLIWVVFERCANNYLAQWAQK